MAPDKMDLIKVGIVGCGNIANLQLRYIKKYIKSENIAFCDENYLRMRWLSEEHGISNTFLDMAHMLEIFKPTVVHVLTPPKSHKDIAIACMEAGCHVFLEKPMCASVPEAEEIVAAAEKLDRLVCIDHLRVFDPQLLKAKRILRSGMLGDVVSIFTKEVTDYITRKKDGLTAKWMEELPGEIFYDILPHHLSIINEFIPDLKVQGVEYQTDSDENPRDLLCMLSSGAGTGIVHLSVSGHLENYAKIECTKGLVLMDFLNRMTVVRKSTRLPGIIDRARDKFSESLQLAVGTFKFLTKRPDNLAGMDTTIRGFYEAACNSGYSPVPSMDGLMVTSLSHEIFNRASKLHKKEKLEKLDSSFSVKPKGLGRQCDVLVTGGTGFIGRRLVTRLLSGGKSVRILAHREYTENREWSSFRDRLNVFKGNISNPMDVEYACEGIKTVYHLAAATKGPWLYHLDTTVAGTQNLVDVCKRFAIESMVYVSTIGIVNTTALGQWSVVDEDFPYEEKVKQRGRYAEAKLMAEMIVRRLMDDPEGKTKVSVIRPGIVYGPGKHPLMGIVQKINNNTSISLEHKKRILPLVYVDNLLDAFELAANAKESGIYNVVDNDSITVNEFVRAYQKETGQRFHTIYLPRQVLTSAFWLLDKLVMVLFGKPSFWLYNLNAKGYRNIYETKRIENRLGWFSRVSLEQALLESAGQR